MRCGKAGELLQGYIEGTLKGGELRALKEHLQVCRKCSHELAILNELDAHLKREVPKYWESIDLAPDFLARLKQIPIEPSSSPAFNLAESLSALWTRHRMALATGLSVCLIIVLALTIPMITRNDDDDMIVSEVPKESDGILMSQIAEEEAQSSVDMEEDMVGLFEAKSFSTGDEMPEAMPIAPPTWKNEAEDERRTLAIEVALSDATVQEHLGGISPIIIAVYPPNRATLAFDEEVPECPATTVVIALEETVSDEKLYVCVDIEKSEVTEISLGD